MNPGDPRHSPADFPGNPNPPAKAPAPAAFPQGQSGPPTSAGTGALPPSAQNSAGSATPFVEPASFSVIENAEGAHDAYIRDDKGPQKLFTIRMAPDDTRKILEASGARYDKTLGSYEGVSEDTVKALSQGRPTAAEYWSRVWEASEAEAVIALNGLQYLDGSKSREQVAADNHLPTLKMQLADRPDMAWLGKGGILAQLMEGHPIEAAERGAEKTIGTVVSWARPIVDVAEKAMVGAGMGGAAAAPLALSAGPFAGAAIETGGIYLGGVAGTFKGIMDMSRGQIAARWLEQGLPDEVVKKWAPIAGVANAALMLGGFKAMSMLGKAMFIDGLAGSVTAQRAMAHWLTKAAGGGAATGGVMAAQSEINSFLHNMAAETAKRPDLYEDPKEAAFNALEAGLAGLTGGMALGVGAAGVGAFLKTGYEKLTPAEKASPEGKKVLASIKRAEKPSVTEAVKEHLNPPVEEAATSESQTPAPRTENQEPSPASGQSGGPSQEGSPSQTRAASEPPSQGKVPSTPEGASSESSSSPAESVAELTGPRQYVPERELGAIPLGDNKLTVNEVLQRYSEMHNEWLTRGNQLVAEIKRLVPTELERQGMFWYKAAGGDAAILQAALTDAEIPEQYKAQIKAAANLSPSALEALSKVDRYYEEAGATANAIGTINSIVENYQNRLYKPEAQEGTGLKTDARRPLQQNTRHAKQRVFASEFDAARYGKEFATTDVADALSIYNHEMATTNTNRAVADGLVNAGVAAWSNEMPPGWARVGELQKEAPVVLKDGTPIIVRYNLIAPEGIADGLRTISEPDWVKKIPLARNYLKAQGTIKTGLLSWSFFHHFTFITQALGNANWKALLDLPTLTKHLDAPEFAELEAHWASRGLLTSMVEGNMDVMQHLTAKEGGALSDISNLPLVKQVLDQTDKNSEFLFGKMQRLFKVYDAASKGAAWLAKHPGATEAEIEAAERAIARHVNPIYGGLNWTAMGMTKANLSIMRGLLLAPDWFTSGLQVLKQALAEKGLAGNLSRAYVARSMVLGMLATEAMNQLMTGHGTGENPPGHRLEIQLANGVYTSLIRGPIGEIMKIGSMTTESGLPGIARYAQGKLAPFVSAIVGALFNVDYAGREIVHRKTKVDGVYEKTGPLAGTYDILAWLVGRLTPTPLAITALIQYLSSENPDALGAAGVTTGMARFSPGKKKKPTGLPD